jgi:hypothetical protein
MTNLQKGLILAVAQLALVASLAAKYAMDRAQLPRVWVQTVPYDPNLPIRGRYISFRLLVSTEYPLENPQNLGWQLRNVTLSVKDGHLFADPADHPTGLHVERWTMNNGGEPATALTEQLAFFLPEHATDPSFRRPGQELWVEVSVPKSGPPRPIQLAIKQGDTFTPLNLR